MSADHRETVLVVIAILGALLSFWIPMPWGVIPAAVTLLIAGTALLKSRRARDR